jgi:hypothetical protein
LVAAVESLAGRTQTWHKQHRRINVLRIEGIPMLRAFAAALALIALPAVAAPCAGFTDVDDSSPFCTNVAWIKNRGITNGCAASVYCPNDAVTRLSLSAFMNRLGDSVLPPNVLWVAPTGGAFQSIQAAIDHAATIATSAKPVLIKVAPGTYNESIRLAQHVRVEGAGQSLTTIKPDTCSPAQPGGVVMTPNSQIVGMTITMEALTCAAAVLFDDGSYGSLVRDISIGGFASFGIWMRGGAGWGGVIERVDMALSAGGHPHGILADLPVSPLLLSDVKMSVAGWTGSTGVKMNGGDAVLTRVEIDVSSPSGPSTYGIDVTWGAVRVRESIIRALGLAITTSAPPPQQGGAFVTNTGIYGAIAGTGIVCLFAYDPSTMAQRTC